MSASAPTSAPFTLKKSGRVSLFVAPFVIIGGLWATPALMVHDALNPPPGEVARTAPDGRRLFVTHCANCHGENGDGKGPAQISPAARHFGYQRFKFGTTPSKQELGYKFAAPTDEDLLAILKRGIPGSSMPAFQKAPDATPNAEVKAQVSAELTDAELKAIIGHVRALTRRGVAARLDHTEILKWMNEYEMSDEEFARVGDLLAGKISGEEEKRKIEKMIAPGRDRVDKKRPQIAAATEVLTAVTVPLVLPAPLPPATPEALANGRQVFAKVGCAGCHGDNGQGGGERLQEPKSGKKEDDKRPRNDDGTLAVPRNLTAGIYKGGGDARSLYARIRLGIDGSQMPASEVNTVGEKDMADLIHFVQSLKDTK